MDFTILQGQLGVRPPVTKHSPAFLELAGQENIRKMISDHYDALVKSEIKGLFPQTEEDLEEAKKHAADFIIQISGGPTYFTDSRGAPQMVGRHAPFRIDAHSRIVWVTLLGEELKKLKTKDGEPMPESVLQDFFNYINVFSLWMVNTPS